MSLKLVFLNPLSPCQGESTPKWSGRGIGGKFGRTNCFI